MSNFIHLASFDIGKRNFAFYIEEINKKELQNIKNIPVKERYNDNGTATPRMRKILRQVWLNGKTILHKNLDISKGENITDQELFCRLTEILDEYAEYFDRCQAFVIEKQMQFGKGKRNPDAVNLSHICFGYFVFKYARCKQIIEFPAYHKTQVLGAPKIPGKPYKSGKTRWKAMAKPQRKKWSVKKAEEILIERGEENVLKGITTVAKKDDLADTLIQLQAFKYRVYVDGKL